MAFLISKSKTKLNHPPEDETPSLPTQAQQMVPFLARNRDGNEEIVYIVSCPTGDFTNWAVIFIELEPGAVPTWCDGAYLNENYKFVRYLDQEESFTIYGGK